MKKEKIYSEYLSQYKKWSVDHKEESLYDKATEDISLVIKEYFRKSESDNFLSSTKEKIKKMRKSAINH